MAVEVGVKMALAEDAKSDMYELIDRHIKDIAMNRRVAELFMGETNEQYDAHLNEMCEKWNAVFADMDKGELLRHMFEDLIEMIGRSKE